MSKVRFRTARVGVTRSRTHAWLLLLALALQSRDLAPAHASSPISPPSSSLAQVGGSAPATPGVGDSSPAPTTSGPGGAVPLTQPLPAPATPNSAGPAPSRRSPSSRTGAFQGPPAGELPVEIWQPETWQTPRRARRSEPSAGSGSLLPITPGSARRPVGPERSGQRVDPLTGVPLGPPVRPGAAGPPDPRLMPMGPAGSPPGQTMVALPPGRNPMTPVPPRMPGQQGRVVLPSGSPPSGADLPPLAAPPRPAPVSPAKDSVGPWSVLIPLLALAGAVGVFLAERNRRSTGVEGLGDARPRINLVDRLRPGSGGAPPRDG